MLSNSDHLSGEGLSRCDGLDYADVLMLLLAATLALPVLYFTGHGIVAAIMTIAGSYALGVS